MRSKLGHSYNTRTRTRGKRVTPRASATWATMPEAHVADAVEVRPPAPAPAGQTLFDALQRRMCWLESSPGTVAAMMAVMVAKMPSAHSAWAFVRHCARALSKQSATHTASAVTRHPAVIHALLRRCVHVGVDTTRGQSDAQERVTHDSNRAATPAVVGTVQHNTVHVIGEESNTVRHDVPADGAEDMAATVLLTQSGAHVATPTDILSAVVLQLRRARRVSLAVRVLQEHMVPTQSQLSGPAMEAMLECVLAHNRSVHAMEWGGGAWSDKSVSLHTGAMVSRRNVTQEEKEESEENVSRRGGSNTLPCSHMGVVHWKSALSWVVDLRAPDAPRGIVRTGTGNEERVGVIRGAPARQSRSLLLPAVTPLSPRALNLLVRICVDGGSPLGALRALGYARAVSKLELAMHAELRALLYCDWYHRPAEARAIVQHARARYGAQAAQPLQEILELICCVKKRQAGGAACGWTSNVTVKETGATSC